MTDRKQRAVNWVAIVSALGAAGGTVVESYRKGDTDDQLKQVIGRELAAYKEWKTGATDDLKLLEAENKQLRESVAGLTATVKMLADHGRTRAARREIAEVEKYVAQPTPDSVEEVVELKAEPRPRPVPAEILGAKAKKGSRLKASRKIEINQQQVQQQVEELF